MTSSSITQAAFLSLTVAVMGDDDESTPTAARRRKATSSATATSAATASKSGSGQEQEREKSRSARNGSRWVMKYMLQSQLIINFGEIMIVFLLMNFCGEKMWIAKRTSPYLGFNSCNSIQSHFSANRQSQRRRNRRNLKRRRSRKERTRPQTKWCARPPHRQGWMVFCN